MTEYKRSFFIGIDLGKKGSICINRNSGPRLEIHSMPMIKDEVDYEELYKLLEPFEAGNGMIIFEKLGQIFGTSKAVAFSMGHQAGALEMACIALCIPYQKIAAKVWQAQMLRGVNVIKKKSITGKTEVKDTKSMALLAIKSLYPGLKLTFGDRATKPHDGLIDSVLICEWARLNY